MSLEKMQPIPEGVYEPLSRHAVELAEALRGLSPEQIGLVADALPPQDMEVLKKLVESKKV